MQCQMLQNACMGHKTNIELHTGFHFCGWGGGVYWEGVDIFDKLIN
jgi:hypothetical protein